MASSNTVARIASLSLHGFTERPSVPTQETYLFLHLNIYVQYKIDDKVTNVVLMVCQHPVLTPVTCISCLALVLTTACQ